MGGEGVITVLTHPDITSRIGSLYCHCTGTDTSATKLQEPFIIENTAFA